MRFWKERRITVAQRNAAIKQAEQSDCQAPAAPPPCITHGQPASIAGLTFWLHNGGIITANDDGTYEATLSGLTQAGIYSFYPDGYSQFIVLAPDDGSSNSTLHLVVTELFGCSTTSGTYVLEETGQSGAFTATAFGHPF